MNKPFVRDAALLLFRAVLGLIFVAHGWEKLFIVGITGTTGQFSAWGVPQPGLSAWICAIAELVGGGLLVVGLLTTIVAGALTLLMAAAIYFMHLDHGFFVADNGVEYPLLLVVSLIMIVVFGSGRASIDGVLSRG
ncbi:DoxX family protein [Corynebacterium pacaense]|uniref:DoxX family protein n=1 Tax=Corynebacterium pacaense TaxID=1816684 RepID=UPI0009BB7801|nr:DoxX family protein [Corynebacterium pacaense]